MGSGSISSASFHAVYHLQEIEPDPIHAIVIKLSFAMRSLQDYNRRSEAEQCIAAARQFYRVTWRIPGFPVNL